MRVVTIILGTLGLCMLQSSMAPAAVIRVPADQPTIQAGIDAAADGDIVSVADGTYTGSGNRNIDFHGKAITVCAERGRYGCLIDLQGSGPAFTFHTGEDYHSVVRGFVIRNGDTGGVPGGAIYCLNASPTIQGNMFASNHSNANGGAVACYGGQATIKHNSFSYNTSGGDGGAIYAQSTGLLLLERNIFGSNQATNGGAVSVRGGMLMAAADCRFVINGASSLGGAVHAADDGTYCYLFQSTFDRNTAQGNAGAVGLFGGADVDVKGCLLTGNSSGNGGGGIYADYNCTLGLTWGTLALNQAAYGGGVAVQGGNTQIDSCILWGNEATSSGNQIIHVSGVLAVEYSCIQDGWSGTGNFGSDPRFTTGPWGDYYLSRQSAGQAVNSPCLDHGNPATVLDALVTQTDGELDLGRADIGYHRLPGRVVAGPGRDYGNPPLVRVFPPEDDAGWQYQFSAYGAPHYGVNVACAKVYYDGGLGRGEQILTGPGPGAIYGPHVRGFLTDGTPLPGLSFLAYGTQKYGVNVAAGDLTGNSRDEIITGAGPGAVFGPHVRAFSYDEASGTVSPVPGVSFFAYGTHKYGVNVAAGDIDGDNWDEIVTGAGPGAVFGPHVRGWNVDGGPAAAIPAVSFLAYGTHRWGVNVSCGDLDGDGLDEIVTAPGPSSSFGAQIRGWNYDGTAVTTMEHFDFFAWPPGESRFGAKICARYDLNGDGAAEVIVGAGPDPSVGTPVRCYDWGGGDGPYMRFSLEAFPAGYTGGTTVAAGGL